MAMLHVMASLAARLGMTLSAHGVDHGLRSAAPMELDVLRACRIARSLVLKSENSKSRLAPPASAGARGSLSISTRSEGE